MFLGNLDFKVQEDEVELLYFVPSNDENTIEPLSVLSSDDENSIAPLSLLSSKSDDFHSRTVKAYPDLLNTLQNDGCTVHIVQCAVHPLGWFQLRR